MRLLKFTVSHSEVFGVITPVPGDAQSGSECLMTAAAVLDEVDEEPFTVS